MPETAGDTASQGKLRVILVGIGYALHSSFRTQTAHARCTQRSNMLGKDHPCQASEEYPPPQCHSAPGCASRWVLLSVTDLTSFR